MKLHSVTHGPSPNRYCGPSALSIITGRTTTEAATRVRYFTGKRAVTGVDARTLLAVLEDWGYTAVPLHAVPKGQGPTLAAWLKDTPRPAGKVFLVCAGWHWQVISGRRYACGRTAGGKPVSIRDKRVKRRARVSHVWEVTIR